jgi:RNA polymerase sigma factor (TIGR02999 family)
LNQSDITGLLERWRAGDKSAETALLDAIYPHLRALAQQALRSTNYRLSLRATELVNEAYLRLLDQRAPFENRDHFIAIASSVMRRVLMDLLRARAAEKRGADIDRVSLELGGDGDQVASEDAIDWLALDEALTTLEQRDATAARVVELRYFGGFNNEEVAVELGMGVATIVRRWQFARAWLHKRL